ncbi:helix-turn-helix domain-containing protein [Rhodococcus sp. NCIMB 12038]|uniref:AlbA family DNA-binding domain-containing protein n=1 Tax=Rhodococcus sp. NCIMB 12038 TaxID=933800 RepID=UPI000B3C1E8B|nr:ATP-binding protein [Rhodococcus sp. NCIMB 12038]OUS91941.1 hypothetical protein CA951_31220 [Rhodococcus sp. NCIMB 12038]
MSIYDRVRYNPRLPIEDEKSLVAAMEEGLLTESHYLDLKAEIPKGSSKNRELARDLASFAVDGGTFVVGVAERGEDSVAVPVLLDGLAERIDQVAASIPDPPVTIATQSIPCETPAGYGYLLVHVPPSPEAPHMVDGRYWGRRDITKYQLADAEVVRLHERRRTHERDIGERIRAEFTRDPIPEGVRKQAHLFLLAEPVLGAPDLLAPVTNAPRWQEHVLRLTNGARTSAIEDQLHHLAGTSPDWGALSQFDRRPAGIAVTSFGLEPGRLLRPNQKDEDALEIEIDEDGAVRLFMSRLSDAITPGQQVVFADAPVIHLHRLLALVTSLATESGYHGNWRLGVGATGLAGLRAYFREVRDQSSGYIYSDDQYIRGTVAPLRDIAERPARVIQQLVEPLHRALGVTARFGPPDAQPV